MGSSEKFCLRWNDFETSISGALHEIRTEKEFFDVTLACEDEQIEAHKVILSACSPWFRSALKRNPHQHPLFFLKGIKHSQMMGLIDFMYKGEVSVAQEDLNNFLVVAEELQIKGLTQNNSSNKNTSTSAPLSSKSKRQNTIQSSNSRSSSQNHHMNKVHQSSTSDNSDDIQEIVPVKNEVYQDDMGANSSLVNVDDNYTEYDEEYVQYDDQGNYEGNVPEDGGKAELSQMIWSKIQKLGGGEYMCTECGIRKFSSGLTSLKNHIEAKHIKGAAQYNCQYCEKMFYTSNSLHSHISLRHPKC